MAFTAPDSYDVDEVVKKWSDIPTYQKREMFHVANLHAFWAHITLPVQETPEGEKTMQWAAQLGLLDLSENKFMNLKIIYRIEILESILRALENGCLFENLTKQLILLSLQFDREMDCVHQAVCWLIQTGDPDIATQIQKLGSKQNCILALSFIFRTCACYLRTRAYFGRQVLSQWTWVLPCNALDSDVMKMKGNEHFQKGEFINALEWYTKAIHFNPENHVLYGNRALCFIRCRNYLKAAGDGKRAVLIKPDWAKGHYRFCDALFHLGEHKQALQANGWAIHTCGTDVEGLRDLLQQHERFSLVMAAKDGLLSMQNGGSKQRKRKPKRDSSRRTDAWVQADAGSQQTADPTPNKPEELINSGASGNQEAEESGCGKDLGNTGVGTRTNGRDASEDVKREMAEKTQKTEAHIADKPKSKNRNLLPNEKTTEETSSGNVVNQFRWAVQDAHTALTDQRCHNAELAFSQALKILKTAPPQELRVSELDKSVLTYGHSAALLGIGQPEELALAGKQFNQIKDVAKWELRCLAYYGMGKVLFKENRFSKALDEFKSALLIVKQQNVPGKLTWPTTKVIIQESQTDYLRDRLEEYIEKCKFPPKPDAVCRYETCLGNSKIEIYFADPDFKGFIRLVCCQSCNVEFHILCWKKLRASSFSNKTDKEFLQEPCFTPDCDGKICHIVIFGANGLVKCELESSITVAKSTTPVKLKVKQKCTSLRKLKSKEDRKLRQRQCKQAESLARQTDTEEAALQKDDGREDGRRQSAPSLALLSFGDRVLHQISEYQKLFKVETPDVSVFVRSLRPWMDLDEKKESAQPIAAWKEPETLEDVVNLVLERKNRVWARVFIQALSRAPGVSRRLADWACGLNIAGLEAARDFIDRYAEQLEQLHLAPLLSLGPLQDALAELSRALQPEVLAGTTVTAYLKATSDLETIRLFVWVLEEKREHFVSCHQALNEYFEMDCLCVVNKKMENENQINSSIKSKTKYRRKKAKEPKSIVVLTGSRGGTLRQEDDIFFEDDSLSLLDSHNPFIVPNHLRRQVAEFEGQYPQHYRTALDDDISTDPTKDSLYDYFSLILEEHGPLEFHDTLLVGELNNFPWEAHVKIQEAGGLKEFLLGSARFLSSDTHIGLVKHAPLLLDRTEQPVVDNFPFLPTHPQDSTIGRAALNPSAKEFTPSYSVTSPPVYTCITEEAQILHGGINSLEAFSGTYKENITDCCTYEIYPERYIFEHFSDVEYEHLPQTSEHTSKTLMRSVQVQTCSRNTHDVSLNTEPYELFETDKGDMIKKEKNISWLEKKIKQAEKDYTKEQKTRKERVLALEAELKEINQNNEIVSKEIELFQKKLEEEIKKDQQEKRENHETLKALKVEMKELTETHGAITKKTIEKKKEYDKQFNDLIDERNQSEAEKSSLEDEIARFQKLQTGAAARSLAAQASMLEIQRDRDLQELYRYASEKEAILAQMKEMASRSHPSALGKDLQAWQEVLLDVRKKIAVTEAAYKEQMEQLKKGGRLSSLPAVSVPGPPPTPALPRFMSQVSTSRYLEPRLPPMVKPQLLHCGPKVQPDSIQGRGSLRDGTQGVTYGQPSQGPRAPSSEGPRAVAQQHVTVFEKIIDELGTLFPHYDRPVLTKFIQWVCSDNGGSLSSLTCDEVIRRVAQVILDHQEKSQEQMNVARRLRARELGPGCRSPSPASDRSSSTPLPSQAWKAVVTQQRSTCGALNSEDPCIICHEEMSPEDLCVLECRHSFHRECIKSWLKEQRTCPTCRDHTLLPEDFPQLSGKMRRGPPAVASSSSLTPPPPPHFI